MNTTPLPRTSGRDRRTAAERTPQIPVTVRARLAGRVDELTIHTAVGVGGWSDDAAHAVARELGVAASEVSVITRQGGHV